MGSLNAPQTTDVCFSSRSHYLFCASEDHKVRIWDLKRKQSYSNLELSQPVQCVSVNRTDQLLASGLRSSQVVAHYLDQGAPTSQTASIVLDHPQKFPIVKVKFSLFQTAHMVSLSTQGDIIYWDLTKSKIVSSFLHQHTGATSACFSPVNRSLLVTAGLDKVRISNLGMIEKFQVVD